VEAPEPERVLDGGIYSVNCDSGNSHSSRLEIRRGTKLQDAHAVSVKEGEI